MADDKPTKKAATDDIDRDKLRTLGPGDPEPVEDDTPYGQGDWVDATDGSTPPIRELVWISLAEKSADPNVVLARSNGESWDGESNGRQYAQPEVTGFKKADADPPAAPGFAYQEEKAQAKAPAHAG